MLTLSHLGSVLIEWYDLPQSTGANVELRSIALERLARLSVLLSRRISRQLFVPPIALDALKPATYTDLA